MARRFGFMATTTAWAAVIMLLLVAVTGGHGGSLAAGVEREGGKPFPPVPTEPFPPPPASTTAEVLRAAKPSSTNPPCWVAPPTEPFLPAPPCHRRPPAGTPETKTNTSPSTLASTVV
ncbi:Os11g0631400 [Oryza sativa Japonica Group]|uniref:Os11g0631400 protein n=1 Tax=Oryza sativa subsp. japonica TaxID=39947 RepID=A0A0N7KT89_ORYSJ|nr:hypothetical protein EE612_056768 [Oryza sativa]KAF2911777.1 hypothetical protein DAI22_11g205500 [Oryza sativa Japonica Group]BAT14946.1 Os11g0631400 [Oryza sativa Japonica Group]